MDADSPYAGLTIEQLLALEIDAPSPMHPLGTREAPGVVTVITREEMLAAGARDLVDVLRMLPGFFFGVDVEGAIGIGFRGLWGHEGKILLRIDGLEMNELDYDTIQLGNRYPVDQIARVEVIRGPGAIVYGGFAELAVVNVVTRAAADPPGGTVAGVYGQTEEDYARRTLSLQAGGPIAWLPDLHASASAFVGQGQRGHDPYVDFAGTTSEMRGRSAIDPRYLNVDVTYRDLRVHAIYDGYRTTTADGAEAVTPLVEQTYAGVYSEIEQVLHVHQDVRVTPGFRYKRQYPWRVTDRSSPIFADRFVERFVEDLGVVWTPAPVLHLSFSGEATQDHAALLDPTLVGLQRLYSNGLDEVWYWNLALGGEAIWHAPFALVAAGLRGENHSQYGPSLVPRVAITRTLGPVHAKAIWNRAFRAPGIQNLGIEPALLPERTETFELELGSRVGRWAIVTANVFDITILDTIVYGIEVEGDRLVETYENAGRTGTRGGEAELRGFWPHGHVGVGYGFYTAAGKNEVESSAVPGDETVLLAAPAHSGTVRASVRPFDGLSIAPSATVMGPRWAWAPGTEGPTLARFDTDTLLNLWVVWEPPIPGLEVGAGAYDLLDAQPAWLQPYDGGHAPLPGTGRELLLRVSWTWSGE